MPRGKETRRGHLTFRRLSRALCLPRRGAQEWRILEQYQHCWRIPFFLPAVELMSSQCLNPYFIGCLLHEGSEINAGMMTILVVPTFLRFF